MYHSSIHIILCVFWQEKKSIFGNIYNAFKCKLGTHICVEPKIFFPHQIRLFGVLCFVTVLIGEKTNELVDLIYFSVFSCNEVYYIYIYKYRSVCVWFGNNVDSVFDMSLAPTSYMLCNNVHIKIQTYL